MYNIATVVVGIGSVAVPLGGTPALCPEDEVEQSHQGDGEDRDCGKQDTDGKHPLWVWLHIKLGKVFLWRETSNKSRNIKKISYLS